MSDRHGQRRHALVPPRRSDNSGPGDARLSADCRNVGERPHLSGARRGGRLSFGIYLALAAGFLMTPLLTFLGVPTAVAVATGNAHVVASSVSGAVTQYRRNNVDVKMGLVMLIGGLVGTFIGVDVVRHTAPRGAFDRDVADLRHIPWRHRHIDDGRELERLAQDAEPASRCRRASPASTAGSTGCRSRCGSIAQNFT